MGSSKDVLYTSGQKYCHKMNKKTRIINKMIDLDGRFKYKNNKEFR
jgi:hypothetical protein